MSRADVTGTVIAVAAIAMMTIAIARSEQRVNELTDTAISLQNENISLKAQLQELRAERLIVARSSSE